MLSKPEWLKHFRILCCEQQNCPNWKLEKHKIFTGLPLYCSSAIKAVKMSFCICSPRNSPPPPPPLRQPALIYMSKMLIDKTIVGAAKRHLKGAIMHYHLLCLMFRMPDALQQPGVALVAAYSPTPTHSHPPTRTVATSQWWQRMFAQCVLLTSLLQIVTSFTFYFV